MVRVATTKFYFLYSVNLTYVFIFHFLFVFYQHPRMEVEVPNDASNVNEINSNGSNGLSGLSDDVIGSDDPLISGASITIPRFPSFQERKRYAKKNAKAGIWKFFEVYSDKALRHMAYCKICQGDINYTLTMSTGMLTRHMRSKHRKEYEEMLEEAAVKRIEANCNGSSLSTQDETDKLQCSIENFVEFSPGFEKKLLAWIIDTYQPLHACEHPTFREMCRSLSLKAPTIGISKLQNLLSMETALMRVKLRSALKGVQVSITTDAWTSCNNVTFITCTAHFIQPKAWLLHHMPLGIFKKSGTSHAEDVVRYVKNILAGYNIMYSDIFCIVTDTEATMVKAARIFCSDARQEGAELSWHGCIDHLLNLVTKVAFKDFAESEGTMNKARELVGHFSSSSQAEEILLSKQIPGSAVKCIQDVTTRWWSTYSMCERLIRLQPYFSLMEAEGQLDKNLTEMQWKIVKDTTALLEPFMCAQRLLEGESYVSVSMIAFLVWKIRKGLDDAIESPQSSEHVRQLAVKMNNKFEEQWGCGTPGTVATEHLSEGPRRRPKGIPRLALVASLLDPRFKFGPGFSVQDKNYVWNIIGQMMTQIAMLEHQEQDDEPLREPGLNQQQQQQRRQGYVDAMFLELNEMAMAEQAENENNHDHNNNNYQDDILNVVDAELLLYKREQHLPLKKADGSFNNPLDWWRLKQEQYPLLAGIALKVLAIPATSAPSERVFSVAGITIAKERSRLDPANAGELIFLHDVTPAIQRYEASIR